MQRTNVHFHIVGVNKEIFAPIIGRNETKPLLSVEKLKRTPRLCHMFLFNFYDHISPFGSIDHLKKGEKTVILQNLLFFYFISLTLRKKTTLTRSLRCVGFPPFAGLHPS